MVLNSFSPFHAVSIFFVSFMAKSLLHGMFPGFSGFYAFPLFQIAPPVYFSGTKRGTSKLLFALAARAATILLLRATPPADRQTPQFLFPSRRQRHKMPPLQPFPPFPFLVQRGRVQRRSEAEAVCHAWLSTRCVKTRCYFYLTNHLI